RPAASNAFFHSTLTVLSANENARAPQPDTPKGVKCAEKGCPAKRHDGTNSRDARGRMPAWPIRQPKRRRAAVRRTRKSAWLNVEGPRVAWRAGLTRHATRSTTREVTRIATAAR